MGMILNDVGRFNCEIRKESIIISYGDVGEMHPQMIELDIDEIEDLEKVLTDAKKYIKSFEEMG